MSNTAFLLIARKDGSSSSRRQRGFTTKEDVDRAVVRWRATGLNTWWLYGPRHGGERPLLRQWRDDAPGQPAS